MMPTWLYYWLNVCLLCVPQRQFIKEQTSVWERHQHICLRSTLTKPVSGERRAVLDVKMKMRTNQTEALEITSANKPLKINKIIILTFCTSLSVSTVTSPALATDTPLTFISSLGRSSTTCVCWTSDTMTSPYTCLSPRQRSATPRRVARAPSTAMPTLCLVPSIPRLPSPTTWHTHTQIEAVSCVMEELYVVSLQPVIWLSATPLFKFKAPNIKWKCFQIAPWHDVWN